MHLDLYIYLCFVRVQTFAMVNGHRDTLLDGVFTCRLYHGAYGFGVSGPVPITSLSRRAIVNIHVEGKSRFFSVAIASTNVLNFSVHSYGVNHHVAFHYSSLNGRVNRDYDNGAIFTRHHSYEGAPFTATLTLRGSDRTVSFSVNGVPQDGAWALPTTESFYLMLATVKDSGNNIAVIDVSVMKDLA